MTFVSLERGAETGACPMRTLWNCTVAKAVKRVHEEIKNKEIVSSVLNNRHAEVPDRAEGNTATNIDTAI